MASVKLTQEKPLRAFWQNQYRNLLLKPAFKLLRNRGDLPSFWTMPHDTICREILTHGFYERELLTGMVSLVKENTPFSFLSTSSASSPLSPCRATA
jgi:hypothetical protein